MNELTPIPQLKTEIQFYEKQTATGMLEIGKRLIQIQAQLPHGEFGRWCESELNYTDRTARRFMRAYEEFGIRTSMSELNSTQMITMLGLPEEAKTEIVEKNDMSEMTIRQLREEVKKFKEAAQILTERNDGLMQEVKNKPEPEVVEIVKEVKVIPPDYENLKRQAEMYKKASQESSKAYEKILSENTALRKQNENRKRNYNNLDPGVFTTYLRNFITDMKKYEAMSDDFVELDQQDEELIMTWIYRVNEQMTQMEMLIKNMEVIEIE